MRKPTAYAGAGGAPGALRRRDSVYIQICSFVYPFGGDGGRNREDEARAGQFIFVFLSLFELCEYTNVSNNQMRTFDVGKQGGIVHVNIRSPSSSSSPCPHLLTSFNSITCSVNFSVKFLFPNLSLEYTPVPNDNATAQYSAMMLILGGYF